MKRLWYTRTKMKNKIIDKFGFVWTYKNGTMRREDDHTSMGGFVCDSLKDGIEWLKLFGYFNKENNDD